MLRCDLERTIVLQALAPQKLFVEVPVNARLAFPSSNDKRVYTVFWVVAASLVRLRLSRLAADGGGDAATFMDVSDTAAGCSFGANGEGWLVFTGETTLGMA